MRLSRRILCPCRCGRYVRVQYGRGYEPPMKWAQELTADPRLELTADDLDGLPQELIDELSIRYPVSTRPAA